LNNIVYELKGGKGIIKEYYDNGKLIFEGEYINGQRNGKGKKCNNDKLIYEGEYLNGKRHGKGREYKEGKLIFEGEYLYDFKIKGKLFINEKLEYDGEFLYNKKWKGKGYDEYGNIIYELVNGNGKIKECHSDKKLKYNNLNKQKNVKGKQYWKKNKILFEWEYLKGKRKVKKIIEDKFLFKKSFHIQDNFVYDKVGIFHLLFIIYKIKIMN